MGLGFREILVILLVVLIIFGGKKLPELGRGLGKGLSNFRKALGEKDEPESARNDESQSDKETKA
ncbi:MAG: twin-arginine translocase TatA/TatE family subunit [Deltaproteobacteria bacterium]|jgi:sec-independent protein translocase protein TatA|nr:twin-arginine translocase TatA/TatE family subunit [Deltaproteobacteria bacterium]